MRGESKARWSRGRSGVRWTVAAAVLALALPGLGAPCRGETITEDTLTISSSSQVYEAFEGESLDGFRDKYKVKVKVDILTSEAALARLVNGFSDIAATALPLSHRLKSQGFVEIPLCRDRIAVVAHAQVTVHNVTEDQLRGIFEGDITNWSQLGGPDRPLVVVVPSQESAAYKNFSAQVLKGGDLYFDLMTSRSTMVAEVIRRIPWSLSFVAQGAVYGRPQGSKIVSINGLTPEDPGYPYEETYYLVTRGEPKGLIKKFVNYTESAEVRKIVRERGMLPVAAK